MAKRTPKKQNYKYTPEFVSVLTTKLGEWSKNKKSYWLGEFASENGIGRQRLTEIADQYPDFAKAYEIAKQVQENKLFKMGISKKFNTSMAIFALKNVAGWRDNEDTGSGLTEMEVNSLRKIAKNNVDL